MDGGRRIIGSNKKQQLNTWKYNASNQQTTW